MVVYDIAIPTLLSQASVAKQLGVSCFYLISAINMTGCSSEALGGFIDHGIPRLSGNASGIDECMWGHDLRVRWPKDPTNLAILSCSNNIKQPQIGDFLCTESQQSNSLQPTMAAGSIPMI